MGMRFKSSRLFATLSLFSDIFFLHFHTREQKKKKKKKRDGRHHHLASPPQRDQHFHEKVVVALFSFVLGRRGRGRRESLRLRASSPSPDFFFVFTDAVFGGFRAPETETVVDGARVEEARDDDHRDEETVDELDFEQRGVVDVVVIGSEAGEL